VVRHQAWPGLKSWLGKLIGGSFPSADGRFVSLYLFSF
jgi:hypothetical protein